jgi:methyl-accepting chemotaxis protein
LIKRLEVLDAKFRELASQPAMPGFAEQMADIRMEIDRIGGSLGQMVDISVTKGINDVTEGMRQVATAGLSAAESAGEFVDSIQKGAQGTQGTLETLETLETMRKLRSDLLALGEDGGSSITKAVRRGDFKRVKLYLTSRFIWWTRKKNVICK